jgi:hypothetical protein
VKQLFNIQPRNVDTSQFRLFIELGLQGMSVITFGGEHTFTGVSYFSFDANTTVKTVSGIIQQIISIQPLLKQAFKKVDIIYTFPDSLFVPFELMDEANNKEMLEFVYGGSQEETVKRDLMYKHNLYNVYRIPNAVYSLMNGTFPSAVHTHLYSILPDVLKEENGNHLYCIFGNDHIIAMLKKDGKLQVIQNFLYKTPEDAAYHLLNMCQSFNTVASETVLHLNGMIEKVSILYTELYRYFLHLKFENLPIDFLYTDEIKNYPPHFFSHLFTVAT